MYASPVLHDHNEIRKRLLTKLKALAPDFTYEFDLSNGSGRFTAHIIRDGASIWSEEFPGTRPDHDPSLPANVYFWVLTIEDFLVYEVARLGRGY